MGGIKQTQEIELNENHLQWLTSMTEKYGLSDNDKALRIILDYVMDEADQTVVFTEIRCNHCHSMTNQD